ncbi:hypothetical protein LTS10_002723 [Elasticomyces elasticus]|nr:hypothetical protein LTS10_002723 [Elasticomyces elasticus]
MLETYGRIVAQEKANLRGEQEEPAEEEPDWQLKGYWDVEGYAEDKERYRSRLTDGI